VMKRKRGQRTPYNLRCLPCPSRSSRRGRYHGVSWYFAYPPGPAGEPSGSASGLSRKGRRP
jgi:hypothetical protein